MLVACKFQTYLEKAMSFALLEHFEILSDTWYGSSNKDESEDELRLIKTAAAITSCEIKSGLYDCSHFPAVDQIFTENSNDIIPELFKVLTYEITRHKTLTTEKEKVIEGKTISIDYAIISAVRP